MWCIKFTDRRGNIWYYHEIESDLNGVGYPVQIGCTPFRDKITAGVKLDQINESYRKFGLTDGQVVPQNWFEADLKL